MLENNGAIGRILYDFPVNSCINDSRLRIVALYDKGCATGMLGIAVPLSLIPDEGRQCILSFVKEGSDVIGLIVPVREVTAGGSQPDVSAINEEFVAAVGRYMQDKACGLGVQPEGASEMKYFVRFQTGAGAGYPLGAPRLVKQRWLNGLAEGRRADKDGNNKKETAEH